MRRSEASTSRRRTVFLWVLVLAVLAATVPTAESVSPRRLRQAQVTTATDNGAATVVPADAAASETATTIEDDTHTWELVETTTQPTTVPVSSAASSPSGSIHQAQLDFQEKISTNAPASSASASSSATATHQSTPMMGYVVVGAMAIVCVGVAAGVAKRKRETAGSSH